jgi:hypothetical protein
MVGCSHSSGTQVRHRTAASRTPAISSFLLGALADGPVLVTELEAGARAVGLLQDGRRIADTRVFKQTKKALGVQSRRGGFGRDGMWYWYLPIQPSDSALQTRVDVLAKDAAALADEAVYGGDHSRPARGHPSPSALAGEHTPRQGISRDRGRGVYRLHHLPAHAGVPAHRWFTFLSDVDQFIQSPWAERAADLGWDAASLFGCHPARPLDHLNGAGLLWRLSGGRIVGMHAAWAVIEVNGKEQVVHRRPAPVNFVLPWARRAH